MANMAEKKLPKKLDQAALELMTPKERMRYEIDLDREKAKDTLRAMAPWEIFNLFDDDDSGLINFDEFRAMLPYLEININEAKAYRYFLICDSDGSREIDIDEFKVALFICDPTSGNPIGFIPPPFLCPIDAYEMFDDQNTGFLDEDQFFYALEYMGVNPSDHKHDKLFKQFDLNNTGSIDIDEFREAFMILCNVKKELEQRGVDVPTFARRKTLVNILREMILEEEKKERAAVAEAKRYKKWILAVREKAKALQQAGFRAYNELRNAMDAAGHVYIFGGGTHKQFDMPETKSLKYQQSNFKFENFDRIVELWKDRVQPEQLITRLKLQRKTEEEDERRDMERGTGMGALGAQNANKKVVIDPYKEALQSSFKGIKVAMNTAALWGRRIHHVAISESVLFALADTGEVYTLGGASFWWHEIQPDSIYQSKWRGDTTARSKLLLGTMEKQLPPDESMDAVKAGAEMSPEEKMAEVIKVTCKYYNVWEPPPNPQTRMIYLMKELLPKVQYDGVRFSLKCRGKDLGDKTKLELCNELYEDIIMEKKLLGERAHKAIRELETQIKDLEKRGKRSLAEKFLSKIDDMWQPLREVQAEQRATAVARELARVHEKAMKVETDYTDMRGRLVKKREDLDVKLSARGNSLQIDISGVTPRGPFLQTPRGFQAAIQISAGTAHACMVHKSGQLYSWGQGSSGRLGLDLTEDGDPQKDAGTPRLVQALYGRPVLRVSCGYSHTGAIVAGGDLYMWGSAANGKCGLGPLVKKEECYCSIPTKVPIGGLAMDRKIRKLSCGAAHTAVITEQGLLYTFGCGDGGRLGIGEGCYDTVYEPVLVESLAKAGEVLATVSCGNTTTIVTTEIRHEWVGEGGVRFRVLAGGRVYVAGSQNVLGFVADEFKLLTGSKNGSNIENTPIRAASAGFQHTVLVSAEGELYCWGFNRQVCCGVEPNVPFIESPTVVPCLYSNPTNLALGKTAYTSSTFKKRTGQYAVNGDKDGNGIKRLCVTQQDAQAWLEVDLGQLCIIEEVRLWNRTDTPTEKNQPKDLYTNRLFPCWVMVNRVPFSKMDGQIGLKDNLRDCVAKVKFTENQRMSSWRLPKNTQSRYVRVQLEGFETLAIAELEVFGNYGISKGVGRVSFAAAGRDVTVAVVRPSNDPRDIENAYKRAAWADSANADVLRQLETFALEYDKFGRGEVLAGDCSICHGSPKCEACLLYETYKEEIAKIPPGIGGRRRRLASIDDYLINISKPDLERAVVNKKVRPTKADHRRERFAKIASLFTFSSSRHRHRHGKEEITPEAALAQDPQLILERMRDEEDAKNRAMGLESQTMARMMRSGMKKKGKDDEEQLEESKSVSASVGTEVMKKMPTFSSPEALAKKELTVGDVMLTGFKLKGPVPKAIADPASKMMESKRKDEEKRNLENMKLEAQKKRDKALKKTGNVG